MNPTPSKDPHLTQVVDGYPLTVEATSAGLAIDPTPPGALFVRNNLGMPGASDWQVEISGVLRPARTAISDVTDGLERVELVAVLQCAGNGRSRLPDPVPGVQWGLGGMGCPQWSGVRLRDVLDRFGGADGPANYLTVLGAEAGSDDPDRVERSIPFAVALERAVLADSLDGRPLPAEHGGPLRLVVPGYYAVNSVKWVRRIAVTEDETDALIQATRYRLAPPGSQPGPEHPSLWEMGPRAVVTHAVVDEAGGLAVTGVAFSGDGQVTSVEVSADEGASWTPATMRAGAGPYAWRRFEARIPGFARTIAARASTATSSQPRHTVPTVDGYAIDGWHELAYTVGSPDEAPPGSS